MAPQANIGRVSVAYAHVPTTRACRTDPVRLTAPADLVDLIAVNMSGDF